LRTVAAQLLDTFHSHDKEKHTMWQMITNIRHAFWVTFGLPARFHFWGSLAIVALVSIVISNQMSDRTNFADSELHDDVMDRWGAPIRQPAPSVRFVPSGTVFNALTPLMLERQEVTVDSSMNYRKRGLAYFSGFDFAFRGEYQAFNTQREDIDIVFVFPIDLEKNKTLLSELTFTVNGAPEKAALNEGNKLVWTGRVKPNERADFVVSFKGRGLDEFTYVLDPDAGVKNFHLGLHITGGANFDYAEGVVSAHQAKHSGNEAWLDWNYASLESGTPVGVILPSEKSFDRLIATMVARAWAPFCLLFAGLIALALVEQRKLHFFESYLVAAGYGLFFVLLAYLAAFANFYLAWTLSLLVVGAMLTMYLKRLLPNQPTRRFLALLAATLATPTAAVLLEGYTGLIYTFEILGLICTLMYFTTRESFRRSLAELFSPVTQQGGLHV
jgi:hypothetical protein